MNEQNLKSMAARPREERVEITRRAGLASAEAKRRKKAMREWAEIIGALPIDVVGPDGKKIEDADLDAAAVMAQYRKASKGDTRAARLILDLRGELVQRVEHTGEVVQIVVRSEDERAKIEGLDTLEV